MQDFGIAGQRAGQDALARCRFKVNKINDLAKKARGVSDSWQIWHTSGILLSMKCAENKT